MMPSRPVSLLLVYIVVFPCHDIHLILFFTGAKRKGIGSLWWWVECNCVVDAAAVTIRSFLSRDECQKEKADSIKRREAKRGEGKGV